MESKLSNCVYSLYSTIVTKLLLFKMLKFFWKIRTNVSQHFAILHTCNYDIEHLVKSAAAVHVGLVGCVAV